MKYLEIKKLSDIIEIVRRSLPNEKIKIICEISQPKETHGNLWFTLKDKTGCIKAVIFQDKLKKIKDKFKDGDKVNVKGKLKLFNSGTINFIVSKIKKTEGKGDVHKLIEETKKKFEKKGYFLKIHKLKIHKFLKKILLVTSKESKARKDFISILKKNKSKIICDLLNVEVGKNCPTSICPKLKKINKRYDLVVITRGGGTDEELFGFSKPKIIEFIYSFDQPVLSAIGHQPDKPLLDLVADAVAPTPTGAAQYIIDLNKSYIRKINFIKNELNRKLANIQLKRIKKIRLLKTNLFENRNSISNEMNKIKNNYWRLLTKIPNDNFKKINDIKNLFNQNKIIFDRIKLNFKNKLKTDLTKYIMDLENLLYNMNKKQDITLYCNNKKIESPRLLNKKIFKNRNITMVWNNFQYKVIFKETSVLFNNN